MAMHPDRRRFLKKASAGALAGVALGAVAEPAQAAAAQPQVLILGAGMSGVSTGYWLRQLGISSLILEGRTRIGGRIWSSDYWPDAILDMGAAFVHDSPHSVLTPLVQKFGIDTRDTDFTNSVMITANGTKLNSAQFVQALALYGTAAGILGADRLALQAAKAPDRPLSTELSKVVASMKLPPDQLAALNGIIEVQIHNHFCAEFTDLSLYYFDQDKNIEANHDLVFPRGYVQLVKKLAQDQNILYGQVVKQVQYNAQGVTVVTNQGIKYTAPYAVVTFPLGVLQNGSVAFTPALPAWKRDSINHVRMGRFDKYFLRFAKPFWDVSKFGFLRIAPPQIDDFKVWFNAVPVTGQPILAALGNGASAQKLETVSDAELVKMLMAAIRQWYPAQQIPDPIDFQRSNWGAEPFSRGCYPHVPVGGTNADYDVLSLPVPYAPNLPPAANRLFFAGDATHRDHVGSVWGAYLSGQREASRIALLH